MSDSIDLLKNPINLMYAVNCQVDDDTLRCGAIYLEPMIPTPNIRLMHTEGVIEVRLPDELLNRIDSYRAWNLDLPIVINRATAVGA